MDTDATVSGNVMASADGYYIISDLSSSSIVYIVAMSHKNGSLSAASKFLYQLHSASHHHIRTANLNLPCTIILFCLLWCREEEVTRCEALEETAERKAAKRQGNKRGQRKRAETAVLR